MHPFLLDTEILGLPVVIAAGSLFTALAAGLGVLLYFLTLRDRTKPGGHFIFLAATAAGALIGAKLVQSLVELALFPGQHPLAVIALSGSSVSGALLGGAAAALIFRAILRGGYVTRSSFDALAVAFSAGDAVMRIGCLFTGCCFGRVAPGFPLALTYPDDWIMRSVFRFDLPAGPRLPFPLIASASLALIALALLLFLRRSKRPGLCAALFLVLYGVYRFSIELIRDEPVRLFLGPLSFHQWFALGCFAAGIALSVIICTAKRGTTVFRSEASSVTRMKVDGDG